MLDTIGELVIAESMVCQSDDFNPFGSPELERRRAELPPLEAVTKTIQDRVPAPR